MKGREKREMSERTRKETKLKDCVDNHHNNNEGNPSVSDPLSG